MLDDGQTKHRKRVALSKMSFAVQKKYSEQFAVLQLFIHGPFLQMVAQTRERTNYSKPNQDLVT